LAQGLAGRSVGLEAANPLLKHLAHRLGLIVDTLLVLDAFNVFADVLGHARGHVLFRHSVRVNTSAHHPKKGEALTRRVRGVHTVYTGVYVDERFGVYMWVGHRCRGVIEKLRSTPELKSIVTALFALLANAGVAPELDPTAGPVHRAAQVGTIISVVVISVVALVGVLVLAQISDSLPTVSDPALNQSQSEILSGFSGAMDLIPVVLIVLVASLVIGIVQRLRG